jgi:hypothetical protein
MDFDKTFRAISIRVFIFRFLIYFVYWLLFYYFLDFVLNDIPEQYSSKFYFRCIISAAFMAAVFAFFFNKKNKHNVKLQFQKLVELFPKSDQNLILLIILSNVVHFRYEKTFKRVVRKMRITNFYTRIPIKEWNENEILEITSTLKY